MKKFAKRYGKHQHDGRYPFSNSILFHGLLGMLCLAILAVSASKALKALDMDLQPESFALASARMVPVGGMANENALYLHGENGQTYIVDGANVQTFEIEMLLTELEPGMQLDVQLARDGVREIAVGNEILLDRETTGNRALTTVAFCGVIALFMAYTGVQLTLRFIALSMKKCMGWKF